MADATALRVTGTSASRVDLVLVAEGYTAAERGKFLTDAQNFTNYVFDPANKTLNDPFYTYRSFFNVSAVFEASNVSGYGASGTAIDTAFKARSASADGRLIFGDQTAVLNAVGSVLAADARDMVIVLINSTNYGGAGGGVAWATAGNRNSYEVALHEIGHSFAGLQDEYVDPVTAPNFPLSSLRSIHVATTNDPNLVPWKDWLGYTDSLGTVGIYEGGYYRATGVWRATQNDKMLALGQPFSAPEKEAFVDKFYTTTAGLVSLAMTGAFSLKATTPDSTLFRYAWSVNGAAAGSTTDSYDLLPSLKASADGTITANVLLSIFDNTGMVRRAAVLASAQDQAATTAIVTKQTMAAAGGTYSSPTGNNALVLGGAGNDTITLNAAAGQVGYVEGGGGNDRVVGSAGNDWFDGGAGVDTFVIGLPRSAVTVTTQGASTILTSAQGIDTLTNVEQVSFSDGQVLSLGGATLPALVSTYPAAVLTQFVTGADPSASQMDTRTTAASNAYLYYANTLKVANPNLGPYESLGVSFSYLPEFQAKYGAGAIGANTAFVAQAYQDVFQRAPAAASQQAFMDQINYFVGIYQGAGLSAAVALQQARGAALGQMLGYVMTDANESNRPGQLIDDRAIAYVNSLGKTAPPLVGVAADDPLAGLAA